MNVYQRFLNNGDPTYYGRFSFQGKRYLRNLGTPNKDDAQTNLRKILRALEGGRLAEVEASKIRQDLAKLSAIFDTYKKYATIPMRTRKNNIGQMRAMIRYGTNKVATVDAEIDALPASILTSQLLRDFQANKMTAAGANKLAQDTAAISANATRRQARSIFKPDLMAIYENLKLPDLTGFLKVKPLPEPPKLYNLPAAELLANIRKNAEDLRTADPNAYRIYVLALGSGLRAGEIKYTRWSWLQKLDDGNYQISIQTNEEFRPKGKRQRQIPLEASAYQALAALRIPNIDPKAPDYILDGHLTERGDKSFDRFSAWMKSQGWTRKKKAHELRKIFGSYVCQQAGLSAAQDLLGHSSPVTTKGHYVDAVELPKIKIFG